jgi:hypothetical protein
VNRWTQRHEPALRRDLDEDESLLDASRVVITAASSIAASDLDEMAGDRNERWLRSRSDRVRRGAARGRGSRHARLAVARELGFPIPGPVFVLGVSDRRVLFWKASAGAATPAELAGSFPLTEVAAIRSARRFGFVRLAVLLEAGPLLVVQPVWTRNLGDLADAFSAVRG